MHRVNRSGRHWIKMGWLAAAIIALGCLSSPALAADTWNAISTRFTTGDFRTVVFGGGRFVATTASRDVWTSSDGQSWGMIGYSAAPRQSQAGTYDGRSMRFVGTGSMYLPNGDRTASASSETVGTTVLWDGRRWIAAGHSSGMQTLAENGIWTTIARSVTDTYRDSLWNNTRYVMVGDGGKVATSLDAENWTVSTLPGAPNLSGVAAGGGRFVAVGPGGAAWRSTTGETWTPAATGVNSTLRDVLWDGAQFIAVGDGGVILTSSNGEAWSPRASGTTSDLWAIARAGDRYVVVGSTGTVLWAGGPPPKVQLDSSRQTLGNSAFSYPLKVLANGPWRVEDLPSWISVAPSSGSGPTTLTVSVQAHTRMEMRWSRFFVGGEVHSVVQNGGVGEWTYAFVNNQGVHQVASDGQRLVTLIQLNGVRTSSNGIDFTPVPASPRDMFYGLTHQHGLFFLVGPGQIRTSADGMTWTDREADSDHVWMDVAWGGGRFVAVGSHVATSPDAQSWTVRSTLRPEYTPAIVYGAGRFVAVGSNGTIVSSSDGIDWTHSTPKTTRQLFDVAWNGSTFLAVGHRRTVLKSTDGIDWQLLNEDSGDPSPGAFSNPYYYLVWDGARWVVSTAGKLITSSDGANWTDLVPHVTNPTGLAFYGGDLVTGTSTGHLARLSAAGGQPSVAIAPDYRRSPGAGETYDLAVTSNGPWAITAPSTVRVTPSNGTGSAVVRIETTSTEGISGRTIRFNIGTATHTVEQLHPSEERFAPELRARGRNDIVTAPGTIDMPVATRDSLAPALHAAYLGVDPYTLQWRRDGVSIPGAVYPYLSLGNLRVDQSGVYDFVLNRSGTETVSPGMTVRILPPAFDEMPLSTQVAAGEALLVPSTFLAHDFRITSIRWYRNGLPMTPLLPGRPAVPLSVGDGGVYRVELVTEAGETFLSPEMQVVVYTPSPSGQGPRLANLSTLNGIGQGANVMIAGFVLEGTGSNDLAIRGIGDTLKKFGVAQPIPDPVLNLYSGDRLVGTADNWTGSDGRELGGFELPAGSRDAVMLTQVTEGARTVHLADVTGQPGDGLVELYLRNPTESTVRLINLSTLSYIRKNGMLTVGFVLTGPGARRVMIRAIGPGLKPFAVEGRAEDPQLSVFRIDPDRTYKIEQNDDWDPYTIQMLGQTGAFALEPGSTDSVVVTTLSAGSYTAVASNHTGAGATMLVEVYLLPE